MTLIGNRVVGSNPLRSPDNYTGQTDLTALNLIHTYSSRSKSINDLMNMYGAALLCLQII